MTCLQLTVCDNLISSMKVVLNGMGQLRIMLENPRNKMHAEVVLSRTEVFTPGSTDLLPDMVMALKELWKDGGVRRSFDKSFEYQLNDSAALLVTLTNKCILYRCIGV